MSKMDNPRRTLEELVTRYQLEPELRDIYVEGKTDKIFFEWFLKHKGIENFAVYEIDTVEIPTQKLLEFGLNDSNRSRAIALALEIQNQFVELPHFTCIADKDFDCKELALRYLKKLDTSIHSTTSLHPRNGNNTIRNV